MGIRSRVAQDRRKLSRIATRLECRFEFVGKSYPAVIIDISPKGAFFSSAFRPPPGSRIGLLIQSNLLEKPLALEAKVLRGGSAFADHGRLERFGVEFGSTPLELTKLVGKMASQRSAL